MTNPTPIRITTRRRGGTSPRTKTLALVLIAVIIAVILFNQAAPSNAKDANTLIYLDQAPYSTLYPPSVGYYPNGGIANNITDRLLYQNPKTLKLEPWIATSLPEINANATKYVFHLRKGVTYSDGTPLDAANVVKNFDLYGKGDKSRRLTKSEQINNYDHGEVIDPLTVAFYFSAPSPGFAQATSTMNAGLLSNKTLDKSIEGFGPGHATEIIGSGPFVITGEKINRELTLKARPDYNWAPPSLRHQGRAYVDGLKIIVSGEPSVRVGALVAGQADIARQINAPEEQHLKDEGLTVYSASTRGLNDSLEFRFMHPLLHDIRVRQAIIHAVDRPHLLKTLFSPSYHPATSALAHDALGYQPQPDYFYNYDPDKANKLLDEAGWTKRDGDGIRIKDGKRLELTVNYAKVLPRARDVITTAQADLARVGIKINLFPGDHAAQNAALRSQDTIQIHHTMVGRADYDVMKSNMSVENRNGMINNLNTGDRHLEALLREIASTAQEKKRAELTGQLQRYVAEKAYLLPLFEEPQVFGVGKNITGFSAEAVGRPWFYNVKKLSK